MYYSELKFNLRVWLGRGPGVITCKVYGVAACVLQRERERERERLETKRVRDRERERQRETKREREKRENG